MLTRRTFCSRAISTGSALAAVHLSQKALADTCEGTTIRLLSRPETPWREPEVRRSVNGELNTVLKVDYTEYELSGHKVRLRSYENMPVGPILRIRAGERLIVRLENNLPSPSDIHMPHECSQPHG